MLFSGATRGFSYRFRRVIYWFLRFAPLQAAWNAGRCSLPRRAHHFDAWPTYARRRFIAMASCQPRLSLHSTMPRCTGFVRQSINTGADTLAVVHDLSPSLFLNAVIRGTATRRCSPHHARALLFDRHIYCRRYASFPATRYVCRRLLRSLTNFAAIFLAMISLAEFAKEMAEHSGAALCQGFQRIIAAMTSAAMRYYID